MTDVKLKTEVMTSQEAEAQVLRAIMFVVFEDYLWATSPEDFQVRFGTRGVDCLRKFTL